ncbi:MAG TPA: hypothetical protein VH590_01700, partial [Ktedonobacterales bacterium]
MDDLEESQAPASSGQPGTAADAAASAFDRQPPASASQGRLVFLLLTLGGLALAVIGQAQLGTYAASGGGAAQVRVPPLLVTFSVLSCIFVAVLLSWRDLQRWRAHRRVRCSVWAEDEPAPAHPALATRLRDALDRFAFALAAMLPPRWPEMRAAWRGWLCALGVVVSLIASLVADVGAETFAGRPAAQWWWVGSVALLLATAALYT